MSGSPSSGGSPRLSGLINHASTLTSLLRQAKSGVGVRAAGSSNQSSLYEMVEDVVKKVVQELNEGTQGQGVLVDKSMAYVGAKIESILQDFINVDSANAHLYTTLQASSAKNIKPFNHYSSSANLLEREGILHDPEHLTSFLNRLELDQGFDLDAKLLKLTDQEKKCLSCFSLFPDGSEIERTVLLYWWIAMGITDVAATAQGDQIPSNLGNQGFIRRVERINNASNCYRLRAAVHPGLKKVSPWFYTAVGLHKNGSFSKAGRDEPESDEDKIQVLLNIDKHTLDATINNTLESLFEGMDFQVAHFGFWHRDTESYIVVEDVDFLRAIKHMDKLRLLSLGGISGIVELPHLVYKLENLRVLDLRACHNLELLPEGIESLKQLTHLDLSECYLLECIPKGIAKLSRLRVLKGFIVNPDKNPKNASPSSSSSSSCGFSELSELQQLDKLAIRTRRMNFPTQGDLQAIRQMGKLKKLRVVWVGSSVHAPTDDTGLEFFPGHLQKLDLQAAPKRTLLELLKVMKEVDNCPSKIYIKGGDHEYLGSHNFCYRGVTQVRLRYLPQLHFNWSQFRLLFPDLNHLDIFGCPNLTDFPCDDNGVWRMNV